MYQNSPLISMLSGTVCEWNYGKAFEERAIRRLSVTAFVGVLVLTIAGCGSSGGEESIAPTPSASQVVKPAAQPFDKPPMVAQQAEEIAISSPAGLIQPTNPTQRDRKSVV